MKRILAMILALGVLGGCVVVAEDDCDDDRTVHHERKKEKKKEEKKYVGQIKTQEQIEKEKK